MTGRADQDRKQSLERRERTWGLEADSPSQELSLTLNSDLALGNLLSVIDSVFSPV